MDILCSNVPDVSITCGLCYLPCFPLYLVSLSIGEDLFLTCLLFSVCCVHFLVFPQVAEH